MPGGSSQGTLWTLLASWIRDHHRGGPKLNPVKNLNKGNLDNIAFVIHWLGWGFSRWTLEEGQGLFTPWTWCYWRGRPPILVPALTPCYHCNPIDPQFWKEKEPGIFHMQADMVMLNPGSTSEIKLALKNLRVGWAFPLRWALPQYIGLTFERLKESIRWRLALNPTRRKRVTGGAFPLQ